VNYCTFISICIANSFISMHYFTCHCMNHSLSLTFSRTITTCSHNIHNAISLTNLLESAKYHVRSYSLQSPLSKRNAVRALNPFCSPEACHTQKCANAYLNSSNHNSFILQSPFQKRSFSDTNANSNNDAAEGIATATPCDSGPSLRAPRFPPESQRPLSYKPSSPAAIPLVSPFSRAAHPYAPHVSQTINRYDLIVIGSGPAGQKCAINAAKNKKRVAIVDRRDMFGGVCIHTGTIPSKTFREAVLYLTGYRQRGFYG